MATKYSITEVNGRTPGPDGKIILPDASVPFLGSVKPTDTPTGTGAANWSATEAGTYTNFGGVVVNPSSFASISRDASGNFTISQTPIPQPENKINPWVAQSYVSGSQVNYLGKDWVANAAIVAGDIPGISSKWTERLYAYNYTEEIYELKTKKIVDTNYRPTSPGSYHNLGIVLKKDKKYRLKITLSNFTYPSINNVATFKTTTGSAQVDVITSLFESTFAVNKTNYAFYTPTDDCSYFKVQMGSAYVSNGTENIHVEIFEDGVKSGISGTTLAEYGISDCFISTDLKTISIGGKSVTPITTHQTLITKEDVSNKKTIIDNTATYEGYASAKGVWELFKNINATAFSNLSNEVTELSQDLNQEVLDRINANNTILNSFEGYIDDVVNKNKGLFDSVSELINRISNPNVGDYAFVITTFPKANRYSYNNGSWGIVGSEVNFVDTDIKYGNLYTLVYKKEGLSWTQSIQSIEDEASSAYELDGLFRTLMFPNKIIELDSTVYKKSGTKWEGNCVLKSSLDDNTTTSPFPLVTALQVHDFEITGIKFQNIDAYKIYLTNFGTATQNKISENICLKIDRCTDWKVERCSFYRYNHGIKSISNQRFSIIDNTFKQGLEEHGYSTDMGYLGYGDLPNVTGWNSSADFCSGSSTYSAADEVSNDWIVANNRFLSVCQRIGFEIQTQAANTSRGLLVNNVFVGQRQALKVYKGSLGVLSKNTSHVRSVVISGNMISDCMELGIYIRANLGCLITGNYLRNCGTLPQVSGAAYGGIVTRINPEVTGTGKPLDAGNVIIGNYVYNCGRSGMYKGVEIAAASPRAIHVRTQSTLCVNNYVVQEIDYTDKTGSGIFMGNGDPVDGSKVLNNYIFNFASGIAYSDSRTTDNTKVILDGNIINRTNTSISYYTAAKRINAVYNSDLTISNNKLYDSSLGMSILMGYNAKIYGNTFNNIETLFNTNGSYYGLTIGKNMIIKDNIFNRYLNLSRLGSGLVSITTSSRYFGGNFSTREGFIPTTQDFTLYGGITGSIKTSEDIAVEGAIIKFTSESTGAVRSATTNINGEYELVALEGSHNIIITYNAIDYDKGTITIGEMNFGLNFIL